MNTRRMLITALLLLSTPALAALDLAGVSLGAPITSVKEVFAKTSPELDITPVMLDGVLVGYEGNLKPGKRATEEFEALVALADKSSQFVWMVGRKAELANGQEIGSSVFQKTLESKYGPPSATSTNLREANFSATWIYPVTGPQYFGELPSSPCRNGEIAGTTDRVSLKDFKVPFEFYSECKTIIYAEAKFNKAGLITSYQIALVDAQSAYTAAKAQMLAGKRAQERAVQDILDRGNKPKL